MTLKEKIKKIIHDSHCSIPTENGIDCHYGDDRCVEKILEAVQEALPKKKYPVDGYGFDGEDKSDELNKGYNQAIEIDRRENVTKFYDKPTK